jgi:hypothetical protein
MVLKEVTDFSRLSPVLVSGLQRMIPPLDVYSVRTDETSWLGPADSLEKALEIARQTGAGSYLIFSQTTGHKNFYEVDPNGTIQQRYRPSGASSNEVT